MHLRAALQRPASSVGIAFASAIANKKTAPTAMGAVEDNTTGESRNV